MFLTNQGVTQIHNEIQTLKQDLETTRIAIKDAREQGDLSENEEFHAAKNKHGKITERIIYLEEILENARIIDPIQNKKSSVDFGATVTIQNLSTSEKKTYTILDSYESDPAHNKISIHTSIAKAMLNLEVGSFFSVNIQNKPTDFELINIEYKKIT